MSSASVWIIARLLFCIHCVLWSSGQSRLVAAHASLTKTNHLRDILYMHFFHRLCYCNRSLGPVSIFFTMGGDNHAPMIGGSVHSNQPPIPLPSLSPSSSVPPPPLCRLVPAMTKWRWAVALAAIQPDSLIGPTECLSGSPRVTTAAFYYSVKWGVKDRYGCSYLTMQNVSLLGSKIRGQRGNQPPECFLLRLTAQVHRNNPMLLFTSQSKTICVFLGEICPEIC